ncbi:MAG: recombinase family protein [Chloroflexi bacterium]|nr:recombinase family protein [Chloroflexota bacterium]
MAKPEKRAPVTVQQLDSLVQAAATAASYEEGFGVQECDLGRRDWWAAYVRQSLEEQAQNNRIPEYLLTCARMAKETGIVVPREYVVVDHESSDYLDRQHMRLLRKELIAKRRIAGVLIPQQGRLAADAGLQSIFERECNYYGVRFVFGDAPSGSDWASTTSRLIMAQAQALRLKTNRDNARAGNVGRVLKGMVPASRAAYGYRYQRDAEITQDGRVRIKNAWWKIDELGPDGVPLQDSPAWVVAQVFVWVGDEERTLYWVANKLNDLGIKGPEGGKWSPARVSNIVHHRCYTGNHAYNTNAKVPNPSKPLGDITAQVKRTLRRPKPEVEWVRFKVPVLVTEELWQKANANIAERGRGRGKQGQSIQALLRNRIFCPKCDKPMVVRRDGRQNGVFYHCSKYFRPWAENPCDYRKFIPGTWDDLVWGDICTWLTNDAWVEQQLVSEQSQDENVEKLIRLEQFKISQAQARIAKVHVGFEGDIYTVDEAKRRIADHQASIAKAEAETHRLQQSVRASSSGGADIEAMREGLRKLRDRNLDEATFKEKVDIICKLGIKVYPSDDVRSMRVACQLNLDQVHSDWGSRIIESSKSQANGGCESTTGCRIVRFGSTNWYLEV